MTEYVFAYGSLLGLEPAGPCTLRDHARGWDVAMDNTKTIPGYKFYVDPQTGERPAVYVAFLAIRPEPGATEMRKKALSIRPCSTARPCSIRVRKTCTLIALNSLMAAMARRRRGRCRM